MLLPAILTLFATLTACHRLQQRSLQGRQFATGPVYTGTKVREFNISMPVDHFNASDTRMYNNRYWVNDTFYKPGGPVFLIDNGESGVSDYLSEYWLTDFYGESSVMTLAQQYNGLVVLWEHRYFGLSLPVPFNESRVTYIAPIDDPQGWAYLTVEQALADVAYFAKNMSTGGYQRDNMTALDPSNTPWIWIGGSYPGERGAWARILYPDVIYATWASSAVPEEKIDGSTYFAAAERSLPSNCSTDLRAVIAYVDGILGGDPTSQDYLTVQRYMYAAQTVGTAYFFGYNYSDVTSYNLSFAAELNTLEIADIMTMAILGGSTQSYGPALTNQIFCNYFESFEPGAPGNATQDIYIDAATNPGTAQPSAEGIIASHNNNLTIGLQALTYGLGAFQNYVLVNLTKLENVPVNYTVPPYFNRDHACWYWLTDNQLGWFLGSNPDNITVVSKYRNYTAVHHISDTQFYPEATIKVLPAEPNVAQINAFGGWTMNPTNVMFTSGESDPWRAGGVFSIEPGSPEYQPTTKVPACGMTPENGTRYGAVYPGAAHVWDLHYAAYAAALSNDSQGRSPQEAGLALFSAALDVWLPCFQAGASGNVTGPAPYKGSASFEHGRSMLMVVSAVLVAVLGGTVL